MLGLVGSLALGCGDPAPPPRDAAVPVCETPASIALVPAPSPPNQGVPMAAVVWSAAGCELVNDQAHPEIALLVADLEGGFGFELVATRGGRWVVASASAGIPSSTYVANFPRETDVEIVLEQGAERLALTIRVDGDVLTLVALRRG